MDPQQRLILEVVYEALEDAGITLDDISGSQTSVFCGSFTNDYYITTSKDLEQYPTYTVTGSTGNVMMANRISYFYNLHGVSITVDTACSSSLVGFHMGCQSLSTNESDISIVVGSALHFDPHAFIVLSELGMLSSDGRCHTFDRSRNGYARGEGICAAVLKRRHQAEQNGDRIRAIVRCSGANHDGAKQGITLPSTHAQEDLIRTTYKTAGLDPRNTQYFEAHGTGTAQGDPAETRAIGAVFSPDRPSPLYVGSVKSNIGHLEGASGLAGIIKTTLALEYGKIPSNMNFQHPNPDIKFDDWKIEVPQKTIDWPTNENGLRRASINSFGYGGTNAHVILEAYRPSNNFALLPTIILPTEMEDMSRDRPFLIPLTSHSIKAGEMLAAKFASHLQHRRDCEIADFAHTLSSRRSMHQQRSFSIGNDRESILEGLVDPPPAASWTAASKQRPRIGFVFTGQGAQWFAMGRQLIQQSPLFKQSLEKCDAVLQCLADRPEWSIVEELSRTKRASRLDQTRFSQPICTALQLAIIDLLKCWGIAPTAVVGHSSGEIAAAYTAGILSFENAIAAAYYRGLFMSQDPEDSSIRGSMLAVGLSEREAQEEISTYGGKVCIAAVNSPSSVTVSGDEDAIIKLKDSCKERNIFARQLQVGQAFHSYHMLPLASAYQKALEKYATFTTEAAKIRMFSSVTARLADPSRMGPGYWVDNMTRTVRYSDALTGILFDDEDELGVDILVEIGPHPALKGPSQQVMKSLNIDLPYLSSLTRNIPDYNGLLTTAAQLFQLGYPVNLDAVNSDHFIPDSGLPHKVSRGNRLWDIPTYAWEHKRYWAETRPVSEYHNRKHRHSLLGALVPGSVENYPRWRNYLRQKELPWLSDHAINGNVIFPAAGYLSMAIEAVVRINNDVTDIGMISLRNVVVKAALILDESDVGTEVILEMWPSTTSAKSKSDTWYEFAIFSYNEHKRSTEHCCGLISTETGQSTSLRLRSNHDSFETLQGKSDERIQHEVYYHHLHEMGLQYGKSFQLLSGNVETGSGFALGHLHFIPDHFASEPADITIAHATLLDSCFHTIFGAIEQILERPLDEAFVPTFVRSLKLSGSFINVKDAVGLQQFQVRAFARFSSPRIAACDVLVGTKDSSEPLLEFEGLEVTSLGENSKEGVLKRSLFYRTRWQPAFDCLRSDSQHLASKEISGLLDLFAHQHPNSRILHFTSCVGRTKEVLRYLGGQKNARRRFESITVVLPPNCDSEELQHLSDERQGLIFTSQPKPGDYDLVIISSKIEQNVADFSREGGYIIGDECPVPEGDLAKLSANGGLTVWQKSSDSVPKLDSLTLVLHSEPSERTLNLVSQIKLQYGEDRISCTSFSAFTSQSILSDNIVVLSNLDENTFFDEAHDEIATFAAVRELLMSRGKNIVWVLKGATMESANPEQAMILGLARVARSENDQIRLVTLDISAADENSFDVMHLLQAMNPKFQEDEISCRNGCFFIPRVEADDDLNSNFHTGVNSEVKLQPFGKSGPLALNIGKVGLLDTLFFEPDKDVLSHDLADDEVEIEVKASALNFRDIAVAMGIIADDNFGDECAGVVLRVGSKVDQTVFKDGDHVVAWLPGQGAHRTIVRVAASFCQPVGTMSFAEAACFPIILTTAYYSLVDVARLQRNEYVLIHSATGGVGQMAVQIAQMIGANIIATVGSQEKRELLKTKYGLEDNQIFSSRDDGFVQGIMNITNGRGVDVVLNSLAGKLLHASWSCVAVLGRFIEIGKRDIHENAKIEMEPFRRNLMFASVDMITIFECNKPLGERLFSDCSRLVRDGTIKLPTSIVTFTYSDAIKAFRLLQLGKYSGKIVLVPHKDDLVPVRPVTYGYRKLFDSTKTYLLIGGFGGLGRTLAEWMFKKGARSLAFFSRSGDERAEAKELLEWLRARDVHVSVHKGDVTDLTAVETLVQSINNLGGVFQAAMVLNDASLNSMTYGQWQTTVRPKVYGTYNLHRATVNLPLEFFICFSSVSSIVGSKGQANYASANAYLDALMRHRREMGLAGTTMNCGMITGVGAVSENQDLQKIMEKLGYEGVTKEELMYQIEEAVTSNNSLKISPHGTDLHQTITGVNLSRADLYWSQKPMFVNLYANHDFTHQTRQEDETKNLAILLRSTSSSEGRTELILGAFIDKIASVLAVPAEVIQPNKPLSDYGLDSLVAVEFRGWYMKAVGVDLTLFDLLSSPSILSLVKKAVDLVQLNVFSDEAASQSATMLQEAMDKNNYEDMRASSSVATPAHAIPKTDILKPVPMSTFQKRMWFLHNFVEDKTKLNLVLVAHLKGKPDRIVLRQTLNELKARNAILRTRYAEGNDFPEQIVTNDCEFRVGFEDYSTAADKMNALQGLISHSKAKEFNLEEGQVMNATLVNLGDDAYALVIICHHIATDRNDIENFFGQMTKIYDTIQSHGDLLSIAAPQVSYADFAVWHNDVIMSSAFHSHIAFWKEKLSGLPLTCNLLPFSKSERLLVDDLSRSSCTGTLGLKLLKRMKRISALSGATAFHFLLTAFRSFMFRYTEDKDLTILVVDGRRPHPDVEEVLGFFVNMTPIRCQDNCDALFSQLLGDMKDRTLEAVSHSIPFDTIVEAMEIEKTGSHFPLGQIVVNYHMHGVPPKYHTRDFVVHDMEWENIPTACELNLEVWEDSENGLKLSIEYSTNLYGAKDMETFFGDFIAFLSSAIKDYRQPIDEINICGPKQITRLKCISGDRDRSLQGSQVDLDELKEVCNINEPQSVDRCVHEIIHQRYLEQPDAPAVCAWDGDFTYAELNELSSQLAAHLTRKGVGPEVFVSLYFEKSRWTTVTMLGVMKAGGAFVLLDPQHPQERLKKMCRDMNCRLVVSSEKLSTISAQLAAEAIIVGDSNHLWQDPTEDWAPPAISPDNALYAVFTSGSTGTPKCVIIEHRSYCTSASGQISYFGWGKGSRVLQFASYAFDASVMENLTTLMGGGCVCVLSDSERIDAFSEAASRLGITHAFLTPTFSRTVQQATIKSLHTLAMGGEPLTQMDLENWAKIRLLNVYGPSECSAISTVQNQTGSDPSNIGNPIGAVCWVADPDNHNKLVPIGAVGELLIEGPIVGRGYLNDPDRNAKVFIEPPAWLRTIRQHSLSRLYKTGDLVRYSKLGDGSLCIVGRKDSQVKLRGQRFELGEVETHLRQCFGSGIDVVAEIVTPTGSDRSPSLVAFISWTWKQEGQDMMPGSIFATPDNSFHDTVKVVEAKLRDTVPSYMVPTTFIPLIKMPQSRTGKTDRRLLRQAAEKLTNEEIEVYRGPRSEKETASTEADRMLQKVWAAVLHLSPESIRLDDNFFHLGGNSILAIRMASMARANGLEVTVSKTFNHPTLSQLALASHPTTQCSVLVTSPFSLLDESPSRKIVIEAAVDQCCVRRDEIQDIYPCTPMQEGLIALTSQNADMYTAQFVFALPNEIDIDRFQSAWQATAEAHVILRTRIIQIASGKLFQVVVQRGIDWVNSQCLHTYTTADSNEQIQLGGPLARFAIAIQPNDGPRHFVLTLHHALYDGWSLPLILHHVEAAYIGEQLQQRLFSPFIHYTLNSDGKEEFWRSQFTNLNAPVFPSLPSANYVPSAQGFLKSTLSNLNIKKTSHTMATLIRLAWGIVVAHYTDSDDVVFGVTVNGRSAPVPGIDQMTGPTISTVPVRIRIQPDETIKTALSAVQNQSAAMIPFEQIGLQNMCKLSPEAAVACSFQSQLAVLPPIENAGSSLFSPILDSTNNENGYAAFSTYALVIICHLEDNDNAMTITANYDSNIISQEETQRFVQQFQHVLRQIGESPDRQIGQVEVISPQEIQQLERWNVTVPLSHERCIHDLVLDHCAPQPDDCAVLSWDGNLTYSELNEYSLRLSQHLMSLHIRQDELVPLCFNRSKWAIVAMMAILRLGAACVLVDPAHPRSRIQEMVRTSGARMILASSSNEKVVDELASTVVLISSALMDSLPSESSYTLPEIVPSRPAFIIFTSGSTGKPKGIVMEHATLATSLHNYTQGMNMSRETISLHFASYAFDASIYEIFSTLAFGGCICIPSDFDRMNNLSNFIRDHGINWALLTPSTVRLLQPVDVPSLKTLILGGEAITQENVDTWAKEVNLINAYGPAEATICAVGPIPAQGWRIGTIGNVVGGVGWITLPSDPSKLATIGAVGELLLEGPILTGGYLNDPEKTAAAYIESPSWLRRFRPSGQVRLYRSGDLMQYNPDGTIRYIGRKDTQIKLRGQRIELGEVETHLGQCFSDLKEVVVEVILPVGEVANPALVCFVWLEYMSVGGENEPRTEDAFFAKPTARFHSEVVRAESELSNRLPGYMVPKIFIPLLYLPLTNTGKAHRRKLRETAALLSREDLQSYTATPSDVGYSLNNNDHSPPRNLLETNLCKVWSSVLGVEGCGIDDDFFKLGGNSILSMQIVAQIYRELRLKVTVKDVFEYRTVRGLHENILMHDECRNTFQAYDAEQGMVVGEAPLLPIQEWFLEKQINNLEYSYHTFALQTSELDVEKLKVAVSLLQQQHDAFRMRVVRKDGSYAMHFPLNIKEVELRILNAQEFRGQLEIGKKLAFWQSQFDIEQGPLFAVAYIHGYADGLARIWFSIHHLIVDIVSWEILIRDLQTLYNGRNLGIKSSSLRQWAHAIRNYRVSEEERAYWDIIRLQTAQISQLPMPTQPRLQHSSTLSAEKTASLSDAGKILDVSVNEILLTALGSALQEIKEHSLSLVTIEGHGREQVVDQSLDTSRTMGWFTSMYPFKIPPVVDIAHGLADVKKQLRQVPQNGIGYGIIYGYVKHPMPLVSFTYHGRLDHPRTDGDWVLANDSQLRAPEDTPESSSTTDILVFSVSGQMVINIQSRLSPANSKKLINLMENNIDKVIELASAHQEGLGTETDSMNATFAEETFTPYFEYSGTPRKGPTLFLLPPSEGGAESYFNNLVKHLPNSNLVVFNNYYLQNKSSKTFEELALFYLDHIRKVQPAGTYHLLGWSLGGTLALEIAVQLVSSHGGKIGTLAFIDTYFNMPRVIRSIGVPYSDYNIPELEAGFLTSIKLEIDHLVLFKASQMNNNYRTEGERRVFGYYDQSEFNDLDTLIERDRITLVTMDNDTHYSWVHNEHQVGEMCTLLVTFLNSRVN